MKKFIAILLLTIPLCGCVPVALVVGATAGGALIYNKRSFKTMMQDRDAAQTAQDYINEDPILQHKTHINVAVLNHIGLMVGQAQTPELRDRAYALVSRVKNISRIYNEVNIAGPTSMLQRSNDTWITTKVKTEMLGKHGLHSDDIKVVTENGVVYLMGKVSREQGLLATNVARRIKGVRKVVQVFQYS